MKKKKRRQTGEWHRREMLVCLPWTACRDVQPRGSVSNGRVRSYVVTPRFGWLNPAFVFVCQGRDGRGAPSFFPISFVFKIEWAGNHSPNSHVILVVLPPPLTPLFPPPLLHLDPLPLEALILHLRRPCLLATPSPPITALPLILCREFGPISRPGKQLHPALLDGEVRQHLYLPWLPECPSVVYHRPSRAFLHSWAR